MHIISEPQQYCIIIQENEQWREKINISIISFLYKEYYIYIGGLLQLMLIIPSALKIQKIIFL